MEGRTRNKERERATADHCRKGENVCGEPSGCGWHEAHLSANFPFIFYLVICVWVCGAACTCVCVCATKRGAAEKLEASSLRDFIREEVHDVVMMCESWRRRRMMKSLPGNHIPTFRAAKVLNQNPGTELPLCV